MRPYRLPGLLVFACANWLRAWLVSQQSITTIALSAGKDGAAQSMVQRHPLFGDHDLVAFGIADANLTGCALHGKDLHPTVDEALSNSRQAVYLDAKVLDAAAAKRLFFGEHQPHGSVAQQNRAVRLSPYHC